LDSSDKWILFVKRRAGKALEGLDVDFCTDARNMKKVPRKIVEQMRASFTEETLQDPVIEEYIVELLQTRTAMRGSTGGG